MTDTPAEIWISPETMAIKTTPPDMRWWHEQIMVKYIRADLVDRPMKITAAVDGEGLAKVREHISASLGALTWEDPKAAETWLTDAKHIIDRIMGGEPC